MTGKSVAINRNLVLAVFLPVIAAGLQWLLWPYVQPFIWFLFYPAVFFSSWIGGRLGGVLATLESIGLAIYVFAPPSFIFRVDNPSAMYSAALFMVMGMLFSYVQAAWKQANRRVDLLEQLQTSEARYRELMEHANSAIIRWQPDGTVVFFNACAENLFGYRANEIIGQDVRILTPEEESTGCHLTLLIQDIVTHPERFEQNVNENVCRDGRRLWIAWTNTPIRDQAGQITEILAVGTDITARRQTEEQLRLSQLTYEGILNSITEVVYVQAESGVFRYVSRAAEDMYGYAAADFIGRTPEFLAAPGKNDLAAIAVKVREAYAGTPQRFEFWGKRKDGSIFPKEVSLTPGRYFNEPVVIAVARDITERRQAERRIRYLARLYATLNQVNQTIVRVKDRQELFDTICRVVIDMGEFQLAWIGLFDPATGQLMPMAEHGQAANRPPVGPVNLKEAPFRSGLMGRAMVSGQVEVCRDIQTDADMGHWRETTQQGQFHSAAAIPVHQQGQVVGLLNLYAADVDFFTVEEEQSLLAEMGLDISFALDTLQTKSARQQAEARSKALVEHAPDGIVLIGRTDQFTYVSPSVQKIFGYQLADLAQVDPAELTHPDERAMVLAALSAMIQDPTYVPTLQYRFQHQDGSWRWVESTFSNLLAEPGVEAIVINFHDITQRKLAEANIQQLNAELEQRVAQRTAQLAAANERLTELDRLKSKFVSDVSHDLRSPVTNLALYIGLLDRGKPDKRDYYVDQLKVQLERLTNLINDILDLSRLERDQGETSRSLVDINAIVEHVCTVEQIAAEAASLTFTCVVDDHLPPVMAWPDQLTRAITNLVSNAIKYTQAGEVRVLTGVQGERVCIQVIDTGPGIAPEDVPHLFERFYRGRKVARSNIPGTGLGLAIVKEIVEAHGGTVEVTSELGVGSTFNLWLPLSIS